MGSWCSYVEDSFPVGADKQTLNPWSKAQLAIVVKRKDLPMVQLTIGYLEKHIFMTIKLKHKGEIWNCSY